MFGFPSAGHKILHRGPQVVHPGVRLKYLFNIANNQMYVTKQHFVITDEIIAIKLAEQAEPFLNIAFIPTTVF